MAPEFSRSSEILKLCFLFQSHQWTKVICWYLNLLLFFSFNGGLKFFWLWKISNINVGRISIIVCIPIASNCQLMAELLFFFNWLIDWLISRAYRFSSCGDTWNIPRPGIEPVSLALADRFLTTGLPGKLLSLFLLYESFNLPLSTPWIFWSNSQTLYYYT